MAVNNNDDGRAVLYRSEIDHDIAEISLLYHFGAVGRSRPLAALPIPGMVRWESGTARRNLHQSE